MSLLEPATSALPTPAIRRTAILAFALAAGAFALPEFLLVWIPATTEATAWLARATVALLVLLFGAIAVLALVLRHRSPAALNLQKAIQAANERLAASRKDP
jgi:membrane protein implicated in regulation of membrane protease activity